MNFLIFQLRRLLMLPVRLVTAPMELFSALSGEEGRSSAFMKGLPAVLIAVIGTVAVVAVSMGGKQMLVDRYSEGLRKTANRKEILLSEIQQKLTSQESLGSVSAASSKKLPEDDPLSKEYKQLDRKEEIYLDKLVVLEPEQQKFKYQMAMRALQKNEKDFAKCLNLLSQIAPVDAAGYPQAHLQLAGYFENRPARTTLQKLANVDLALTHVEHCLTNDIDNFDALKKKASLLSQKGSQTEALATYKKIFAADPKYFEPLLRYQPDESDRQAILLTASNKFSEKLKSSEVQKASKQWVPAWQGYARAMSMRKEFAELEKRLLLELDRYKDSSDNLARVPLLKQYLAQLYISWSVSDYGNPLEGIGSWSEADQLATLEYFDKAKSYDENNRLVLQVVSSLAFSRYDSVRVKAKESYDAESQEKLPSEVLNQLGSQALGVKDYKLAQKYYERARTQSPESPQILNNLAYAYLQGEDEGDFSDPLNSRRRKSNAERAHDLVKQAMRLLPASQRNSPNMAKYKHTLGTALMQLKNYPAAAAEFETALVISPDDIELLESVVNCYDSFNLDSTPFRNRIAKLESEQKTFP